MLNYAGLYLHYKRNMKMYRNNETVKHKLFY